MTEHSHEQTRSPQTSATKGSGPTKVPEGFRKQPFSFVRRGDRLTPRRQRAWDELAPAALLEVPREILDTSVASHARFDAAEVFGRQGPLVVEIGSGLGEAMAHAAAARPETNFLAVEVWTPGLADLLMKTHGQGITNVRAVQANAPEVLDNLLTEGCADELWVFFPDPWRKKRHHKRRLVSGEFAEKVHRVLRPGGTWRLATDWQEYAIEMREAIEAHGGFENLHPGPLADEEHPDQGWAPRWEGRTLTSFERKAADAGRAARDLAYRRI